MRAFADTNIIVYAESDDDTKTDTAIKLLEAGPVISAQVVNETVAILTRKYGFHCPTPIKSPVLSSSFVKWCPSMPTPSAKPYD